MADSILLFHPSLPHKTKTTTPDPSTTTITPTPSHDTITTNTNHQHHQNHHHHHHKQGVCADLAAAKDGLAKGEALKAELEEAQVKVYAERDEISGTLAAEREAGGDMEQKYQAALKAKAAAEEQLKEVRVYFVSSDVSVSCVLSFSVISYRAVSCFSVMSCRILSCHSPFVMTLR